MTIASLIIDVAANTGKITRDVEKITGQMDRIATSAANAERSTAGITSRMVALGTAAGTFLGNMAYDAVRKVGAALIDVATRGIELAPISSAFQALARSVGESGDAMLRVARTATKGLIGDLDLMQAANKGILLGLPITSASFGTLAQTAVVLGKAMGQGPVKSFDDLITALGRSSPMILDNLGLSVKVGEANEAYARSVGKSADSLTDAEKKLAFYNAAMDAAKRKVAEVGGLQLTLADRVQQARVAFTNFTDALGVAIATSPVINAAFGAFGDAIGSAFGENQTVLVQRLMGVVNTMAIGIVDAAQVGISAAGIIGRAWSGLQLIFSGTASVIASLGLAFANLVAAAANLATKIPGVGDGFKGVATSANNLATFMGGVQQSFHDQAQEALNGVQGNSTFQQTLDRVSGALSTMRNKMAEAARQQVSSATIAAALTKTHEQLGTVSEEAAKKVDKIYKAVEQGTVSLPAAQIPLQVYMATLKEAAAAEEALAKARSVEAGTRTGGGDRGVWNIGVELNLDSARSELARLNDLAATSLSGVVSNIVGQFPSLLTQAFTGGGGLKGAIDSVVSKLGAGLGSKLFVAGGPLNGLGGKLAGMFGNAVGLALPGIGTAIGALAGPVISKLSGLVGKIFSNPEKQVNPIREAFVQMHGGLAALNQKAAEAGVTVKALLDAKNPKAYEQAIRDLNAAFEFQENAMKRLDETTKKYGFSIEELGPAFARQQLDKQAQTLFEDFKILTAAGIDVDTVLGKMGESINQFVGDALRTGTEIPAAMAPMLQRMVEMGTLTDASGNVITDLEASGVRFSETMTQGFAKVVQSVERLADAISRGLGLAIDNIPDPVVTGRVQWNVDPIPGVDGVSTTDVVPMAAGGYGTVTKPTLFLAGEAGPEEVAFSGANKRFAGASQVVDMSAVRSELQALRQQQADQQAYFSSQFARDLSRAVRDEVQKVSVIRR